MLMIRPERAFSIGRAIARVIQNGPDRFVLITASHSSAVHPHQQVVAGDAGVVDEDVDRAEAIERGLDDRLARLAARARVALDRDRAPPSAVISAATASAASVLPRKLIATSAPWPRRPTRWPDPGRGSRR